MKLAIALGGFLGFALVSIAGFVVRRDPPQILLEAGIGCVVGAMLLRWLHSVLVRSVHAAIMQKKHALAAEAAATAAAATAAHKPHGAPAAKS